MKPCIPAHVTQPPERRRPSPPSPVLSYPPRRPRGCLQRGGGCGAPPHRALLTAVPRNAWVCGIEFVVSRGALRLAAALYGSRFSCHKLNLPQDAAPHGSTTAVSTAAAPLRQYLLQQICKSRGTFGRQCDGWLVMDPPNPVGSAPSPPPTQLKMRSPASAPLQGSGTRRPGPPGHPCSTVIHDSVGGASSALLPRVIPSYTRMEPHQLRVPPPRPLPQNPAGWRGF